MVNIGDKVGKYQVVIESHGKESAEAIVKEIKKSMPYLEGAISIQEPQEVRPLNEFIDDKGKRV